MKTRNLTLVVIPIVLVVALLLSLVPGMMQNARNVPPLVVSWPANPSNAQTAPTIFAPSAGADALVVKPEDLEKGVIGNWQYNAGALAILGVCSSNGQYSVGIYFQSQYDWWSPKWPHDCSQPMTKAELKDHLSEWITTLKNIPPQVLTATKAFFGIL